MRRLIHSSLLFLVVASLFGYGSFQEGAELNGPEAPTGLRCEYLVKPLGVDTPRPRLSWILEHSERGQGQSSYEILVSTQPKAEEGDLWASGKVDSTDSIHVVYAGKALKSRSTYDCLVRLSVLWRQAGARRSL